MPGETSHRNADTSGVPNPRLLQSSWPHPVPQRVCSATRLCRYHLTQRLSESWLQQQSQPSVMEAQPSRIAQRDELGWEGAGDLATIIGRTYLIGIAKLRFCPLMS